MEGSTRNIKSIVGIVLTVAVALSMISSIGTVIIGQENFSSKDIVTIQLKESERGILNEAGIHVIEAYDSFVLAEISDRQRTLLENNGIEVGDMLERTRIGLNSYRFDTGEGEPEIPPNLRVDSYPDGDDGLYVVQFIGPVKQTWVEGLGKAGVDIYNYIPFNAFLVRMSSNLENNVRALDFVNWVGIYQPAYKVDPALVNGRAIVTVMDGPTALNTLKSIESFADVIHQSYTPYFEHYTCKVDIDLQALDEIARLPDVIWIEKFIEPTLLDETGSEIVGGIWVADTPYGGPGNYANLQGWDGTNVIVSVTDTGIGDGTVGDAGHVDFETRVIGGTQYGTLTDWVDGYAHGTHCASTIAGDGFEGSGTQYPSSTYYVGLGVAPDAQLYSQRIFDSGGGYQDPGDWTAFFEDAYNSGAYVHQNSWGEGFGDSEYDQLDVDYDIAARDMSAATPGDQPLVICVAAGNSGPGAGTIGSPSSGKSVISIGASEIYHPDAGTYGETGGYSADNPDEIISFSSRGPEDDTRIKPDVVAPGTCVLSARSPSGGSTLHGIFSPDTTYLWCSGTSMACPHTSGCSAVVIDWYEAQFGVRPMPAMVKALLINTAEDPATPDIPNANEGWGRVYLPRIVDPQVGTLLEDNPQLLQTGQTYIRDIASFDNPAEPLKITLVYTDPAAAALANPALINNLNLRVTDPTGDTWYGNAFSAGFSVPNTASGWDNDANNYDDRNNIECVNIAPGDLEAGAYSIEIIAENVAVDAVSGGAIDQDFALVIYNGILDPNLPDLTILTGDLTVTDATPMEGDVITIGATLTNVGIMDEAVGVEVGFYDGNPLTGGTLINIITTSPSTLPALGGTGYGETTWDTSLLAGYHTIYAICDPNKVISELTRGNNTATIDVTVQGYAVDVSCDPNIGAVQPGASNIYDIVVTNTGTLPDSFSLAINNPTSWTAVLSSFQTAVLPSLGSETVQLTVTSPVASMPGEFAVIGVDAVSDSNPAKTDSISTNTTVMPMILLVNDANTAIANYQLALDNNGYLYDTGTTTTDLTLYRIVIWASYGTATLAAADKTALMDFMDSGGCVYINGEDIGWDIAADDDTAIGLGPSPNNFYGLYLYANYLADDSLATYMDGVLGDEITDGMSNYGITGSYPEEISPAGASASTIFTYGDGSPGITAGIKVDTGTEKLVYIGCEYFEGSDAEANKDLLMYRILEWLNPDSPPAVALLNPAGSEEIFSGVIDITWAANDDMGLPAGCVDLYYMDDGENWMPIVSGIDNTGSHLWDTTSLTDSFACKVRINVTDSIGQTTSEESPEYFSVDNAPDDIWFFQVESVNLPPHRDLDMKPCELSIQEILLDVTNPGEFVIDSFATEYIAAGDVDLAGDWNFGVNAKVSSGVADGNLYANVYADDGTPRLLFTTDYCPDLIGTYLVYNEFTWTYTVPVGTTITAGEHVVVELMLHATSGAASSPHYNFANADMPVLGTVAGDYSDTIISDDAREAIEEIDASGIPVMIYFEDFEGGSLSGWTLGGVSNDWEIGTPSGLGSPADPVGAYNGTYSIGNDITGLGTYPGEYENSIPTEGNYIYSPAIDCSLYTGVTLEFYRFLGVESDTFDHASIEVSNNGASWTTVWDHTSGSFTDPDWILVSYDISAVADNEATVYVRFEMGPTDGSVTYCGWNIDDLHLTGSGPVSMLEHKWTTDVPAGEAPYEFLLEARRPNNPDGDDFVFAYSTDDVIYTDMVTVSSQTEGVQTYSLPGGLSGTVYIRVQDTDRTFGSLDLASIEIDQMYISSVGGAPQLFFGLDHYLTPSYVEPVLTPTSLSTYDIDLTGLVPGPSGIWVFVSFPIEASGDVTTVFNDAVHGDGGTTWDYIQWYDNFAKEWKSYSTDKPAPINDMDVIDNTYGFWIHITANAGDEWLTIGSGNMPAGPVLINLYEGWNLVGFPSATTEKAIDTLPPEADMISIYDLAEPYHIKDVTNLNGPDSWMVEGEAYWVRVTADCIWTVNP